MELMYSDVKEKVNILSWPPRSSTAWTKRAWRVLVHRILGDLMLLLWNGFGMNLDLKSAMPKW